MADQNLKSTLQKQEKLLSTLESRFEQMQILYDDEHQRNHESVEGLKSQLLQLTTNSVDNSRKFDELVDLFKQNIKGKHQDSPETGSSYQMGRNQQPRTLGFPPGFPPSTPSHFATYNYHWEEMGFPKSSSETVVGGFQPPDGAGSSATSNAH